MTSEWLVQLEDLAPLRAPEGDDPTVRDELREITGRLAREPTSWADEDRDDVQARFDERAVDWSTRDTPEYRFPLEDALRRGSVPTGGRCIEIGSGTGIQTPTLQGHFATVFAVDLSLQMLTNTPAGRGIQLRADAARLPFTDHCAAAIVCVNAFLFAPEYARVLGPGGRVIFVSTRGDRTPIYLAPEEVLEALRSVDTAFRGVTARAGQGCWTSAGRD